MSFSERACAMFPDGIQLTANGAWVFVKEANAWFWQPWVDSTLEELERKR